MYKILHQDKNTAARIGILKTKSGNIETPFFMPVATKGSVKLIDTDQLKNTGTKAVISNALVLSLYPGLESIKKFNGLHNFMSFKGIIATDSGGFQIIREGFDPKIDNFGLHFKNPYTGKKDLLTPEKAIKIQNELGSDIMMCLDDMLLPGSSEERVEKGVKRTYEWAKICYRSNKNKDQLLFGITQGGINPDLRKKSISLMTSIDFDGFSIGGLAIGEHNKDMFEIVKLSCSLLPKDKPRYLMGVGSPQDLIRSIGLGVDMFDSVYPTRTARRNSLLTKKGPIKILKSAYKDDTSPIEKGCNCYVCRNYSKSYLHSLAKSKELSSMMFNSIHNIHFIQNLIEEAKQNIKEGTFEKFEKDFISNYKINKE